MQVLAIDQHKTSFHSTATVTINIIDTNDNSPHFPMDTYKLKVDEHSPVGTVLGTITVGSYFFSLVRFNCAKALK